MTGFVFKVIYYMLCLIWIIFPVFVYSLIQQPSFDVHYFSVVSGLSAFSLFSLSLLTGSRIKISDRIFGLDRVLVFHRFIAGAGGILSFFHLSLKIVSGYGFSTVTFSGSIALLVYVSITISALMYMTGKSGVLYALFHLFPDVDYCVIRKFHSLSPFIVVLLVVHVSLSSFSEVILQLFFITLYGTFSIMIWLYTRFSHVVLAQKKTLVIAEKILLHPLITVLRFKALNGMPLKKITAGQYAFWKIKSEALTYEEHPFSISSGTDEEYYEITVKKSGDYTQTLDLANPGDLVYMDGPYGRFSAVQDNAPNLIFIAGGIGITPFISMLKSKEYTTCLPRITLIWAVRSDDELIYDSYLQNLMNTRKGFSYIPVVTDPRSEKSEFRTADSTMLNTINLRHGDISVYFCGPPGMRKWLSSQIQKSGLRKSRLFFEKFSL